MAVTSPAIRVGSTKSNAQYDAKAFARATLAHWPALAALFDHTLLKPDATRDQVIKLCEEAAKYRFACAMINPTWTSLAVSLLSGTGIPVGVVVGFPLGASLSSTKRTETEALVTLGAKEIDMVINIGALKSGDHTRVSEDIRGVVEIAHDAGAIVKVILETCLLTVQEKLLASELALQPDAILLSAKSPADVAALRKTIITFFEAAMVDDQIVLPYAKQGLLGDVYDNARVLSEDYDTIGRIMKVRGLPGAIARLRRTLAAS